LRKSEVQQQQQENGRKAFPFYFVGLERTLGLERLHRSAADARPRPSPSNGLAYSELNSVA
jgi:hypothetical protein